MSKKEIPEPTIEEAMDWVAKNCMFADVRKRMRSRAVAYILGMCIVSLSEELTKAQTEIEELKKKLE
jgi:hypothetical protein